jgi:hypothetical protein
MATEDTTKTEVETKEGEPSPDQSQSSETQNQAETKVESQDESKGEVKTETKGEASGDSNASFREAQLAKRVAKLTAQKKELEARVASSQAGGKAPDPADEAAIAARVDALASTKAEVLASVKVAKDRFDRDCNTAISLGKEAFGDEKFAERVNSFKLLQGEGSPEEQQEYTNFLSALLETGEAPKLIFELAGDLKEAQRLMGLPPVRQGIELARRALAKPLEEVSDAPKPITPLKGSGRSHIAIVPSDPSRADDLDKRTWFERRNAEVAEYNKRAGRKVL